MNSYRLLEHTADMGIKAEGKTQAAMACAANFAFANRQLITAWVRESFERVLDKNQADLRMSVIYDVCHNIAKMEEHQVDGKQRLLCVHRKGATRAFPLGHAETPEAYKDVMDVVSVVQQAGIGKIVARLRPLAVIKG